MSLIKRGLVLGQYAPLQYGHQFILETALAAVDELIVVVYDARPPAEIPLAVRADWLRSLYPAAQIREAFRSPPTEASALEWAAYRRYLLETLSLPPPTHYFHAATTGSAASLGLGAADCPVVTGRLLDAALWPDLAAYRAHVPPRVYRDLVTSVVFLGAPSSGKTTLAEHLARELGTPWMPEYGREYWEAHQVNRRLTSVQLVEIAEEHRRREDALLEQAGRYLLVDTNALTTALFARYYHGRVEARLAELAAQAATRYDLVFVCDIDIPYADTWDRSGEVNRQVFHEQILADLSGRRVPYFLLSGTLTERAARVRQVLGRFRKYMNVLELAGVRG